MNKDFDVIIEKIKGLETLFLDKFKQNDKSHTYLVESISKNNKRIGLVERQQIFWKGAITVLSIIVGSFLIPMIVNAFI